jgi:hypothetical protein
LIVLARNAPPSWKSVVRSTGTSRRSVTRTPAAGGAPKSTAPPLELPAPDTVKPVVCSASSNHTLRSLSSNIGKG